MYCKNCQVELEEGNPICPVCGTDNTPAEETAVEETAVEETAVEETAVEETVVEETAAGETLPEEADVCEELAEGEEAEVTEAEEPEETEEAPVKKHAVWKIILAIGGCVVLLAALAAVIVIGVRGGFKPKENNVSYRENYTVTDSGAQKNADKVVATVSGETLTNGELQVYYWMEVYNFLNRYGSYASMLGLDYTKPLNEQFYSEEEGITWQQHFLDNALTSWHQFTVLGLLGNEDGYEMEEEYRTFLNELPQSLEETAASSGIESAKVMIQKDFGAGCDVSGYISYMESNYYGNLYYNSVYEAQEPTMEQLEAFYTENEQSFAQNACGKDAGYPIDVRHVLIQPEGGTKDDSGSTVTYSDEEWEACRVKAQKLLDEWLAGAHTEETFIQLAKDHSKDSNASDGGLYTVDALTNFVKEFKEWYMDESRQAGDYGLVKTEYGYHIMYFSSRHEEEKWVAYARDGVITDYMNGVLKEGAEKYPMDVSYKAIVLGDVPLA